MLIMGLLGRNLQRCLEKAEVRIILDEKMAFFHVAIFCNFLE